MSKIFFNTPESSLTSYICSNTVARAQTNAIHRGIAVAFLRPNLEKGTQTSFFFQK